jgi:phenylalanyl-tRNA synthetase beta chain
MKISYNWLKEYIDFDLSPTELADTLTMLGLETEGKPEKVGGADDDFEGVVIGKVLEVTQHPNADRLRLCRVDVGADEPLPIVCGAPNVAEGQKVPVATVGSILNPVDTDEPLKIKKGKIRGEVSMGMICAEDELGIGHSHEGIMVLDEAWAPGTPFVETLDFEEDYMIEIDLTPNRIDAASHFGVARDLGAFLGKKAQLPKIDLKQESLPAETPISVTIADTEKCKRYSSLYIKGVSVKESPDWLKRRLETIGLRPRNNVVDITNYVLHELGHPLHAFDADKLDGNQIVVRTLEQDQKFVTLEGEERTLKANSDLLICDAEQPHCIAGTMGGQDSGVTEESVNVFLESAYFDPGTVRKQAKRLGISSDSSYRFERGADPNMTVNALLRAASLIVELAGGTASGFDDQVKDSFPPFELNLSVSRTQTIIGAEIGRERIIEILEALEIEVEVGSDEDNLLLKVPPYRVDVQRPQDVMEEILRIYGYNQVEPAAQIHQSLDMRPYRDTNLVRQRYADYLSGNGFFEILNNSLINRELGDEHAIHLVNPLSEELEILRQSLLSGFLETILHNQNRQQEDLALYEFGKTYWQDDQGKYREKRWLAMAVTGHKAPLHWTGETPQVSLFTLGGEVEKLQSWFGFRGVLQEIQHPEFDYGVGLMVGKKGKEVLRYGKVNAELQARYDIKNEVFYLLADWEALLDLYYQEQPKFQPIPIYPGIRRDISMVIDETCMFEEIKKIVQATNPKLIRSIDLYDVYKGKNIPNGKKSYLISIEFRDDNKTLQDKTAEKITERVYKALQSQLGAEIRR